MRQSAISWSAGLMMQARQHSNTMEGGILTAIRVYFLRGCLPCIFQTASQGADSPARIRVTALVVLAALAFGLPTDPDPVPRKTSLPVLVRRNQERACPGCIGRHRRRCGVCRSMGRRILRDRAIGRHSSPNRRIRTPQSCFGRKRAGRRRHRPCPISFQGPLLRQFGAQCVPQHGITAERQGNLNK